MMAHRSFKFFVALALLDTGRTALPAQEPNCEEVAAMARVARAKTGAAVAAERRRAGDTYRARLVFASRELELNPVGKEAAVRLVGLIPKDQQQHVVWMTLGDSLCDQEPLSEMESLGQLRDRLPRDLAEAVLRAPEKLPDYVAYALTSVQDPDSDYAVQMQTVCRQRHSEFVGAVNTLPPDKRAWFSKHILDLDHCRALTLPESGPSRRPAARDEFATRKDPTPWAIGPTP